MYLKLQKQPNASIRGRRHPAQTMAFGHDSASAQWFESTDEADNHRPFQRDMEDIMTDPIKLLPEEAAALQSYPTGFEFKGSKGKQFMQIGNAVPPLLAQRILEALWADDEQKEAAA